MAPQVQRPVGVHLPPPPPPLQLAEPLPPAVLLLPALLLVQAAPLAEDALPHALGQRRPPPLPAAAAELPEQVLPLARLPPSACHAWGPAPARAG